MSGITGNTLTAMPTATVTVERSGADEIWRRYVRADGARCVAGDQPAGVSRVKSTTAGDLVAVDTDGIVVMEAGAAIVLINGSRKVMPDATGRPIQLVGNAAPGGLALDAATAAGDFIRVWLNRA